MLAFAIRELGCVAGVMVTASHNPPAGQRLQGLPRRRQPDRAAGRRGDRRADRGRRAPSPTCRAATAGTVLDEDDRRPLPRHRRRARRATGPRDLDIVYTPLHGVGGTVGAPGARDAPASPRRTSSPQQEQPDPDFPTVAFPNPEEPGAMDLAMALAEQHGADLVVANDPDADRCAAAVPGPHGWRMLRGDEVGALLGAPPAALAASRASTPPRSSRRPCSGKMAAAAGQPYVETLTGFKWIGRVDGLAFGYEEALGYCVDPEHVRDKDGVSALLLLCELAAAAKAEGRTLDRPARRHRRRARPARHRPAVGAGHRPVARSPPRWSGCARTPPTSLGGLAVERVDDLAVGSADLPPTDGPALPPRRRRPGRSSARAAPSPSSSATSRSSSRSSAGRRRRRRPDRRRRPPRRAARDIEGRGGI